VDVTADHETEVSEFEAASGRIVTSDLELVALRESHAALTQGFAALVAERDYLRIQHAEDEAALHAARVKAQQALERSAALQGVHDRLAIQAAHHDAELSALRDAHKDILERFGAIVAERNFIRCTLAELDGKEQAASERARQLTDRLAHLERDRAVGLGAAQADLGVPVIGGDAGSVVQVLVPMADGRQVQLAVPVVPFAARPSCYIFAYAKSGSVLLDLLVRDITAAAGVPAFNLTQQLFLNGASFADSDYDWKRMHVSRGVVHYGFRGYPPGGLPIEAENPMILLVRDPRDMMVSSYFSMAASHGLPAEGPQREELLRSRAFTNEMTVDEYCIKLAHGYLQAFALCREHLDRAKVFRYEDIIFEKHRFVEELCGLMGISLRHEEIDRIARAHDVRPEREDTSAHTRNVTPGDHRRKLKPATISKLNEVFADFMAYYGYALDEEAAPRASSASR
jgi:Sulfotransferase domain